LLLLSEGVKNELDAGRDSQLFINPEKIIADGVFRQPQLLRRLAIRQPVNHQVHDVVFPFREQRLSARIDYPQRRCAHQRVEHKLQLIAVDPDLSLVDGLDAFAENLPGLRPAKYSLRPAAKPVHHQFTRQSPKRDPHPGRSCSQNSILGACNVFVSAITAMQTAAIGDQG
jgi:hypothetical protein